MARPQRRTFSLRFFLAFCCFLGVVCGVGGYRLAMAIFVIALLYLLLFLAGSVAAVRFPDARNPILRPRFIRRTPVNDVPIVVTMCYLVLFYCWHLGWLVNIGPAAYREFWFTPTFLGCSLCTIENCVFVVFHLYVYVSFFGDCYGTGHVSTWNCGMTACFSVLLLASHLAFPYAW